MNPFIKALDESIVLADAYTKDDEDTLLAHILDNSLYQNTAEFALANVTYDDALNLVQSNDSFAEESVEYLSNQSTHTLLPLLLDSVSMDELAYHLAYTEPERSTNLLAELEYYKSQGRFS